MRDSMTLLAIVTGVRAVMRLTDALALTLVIRARAYASRAPQTRPNEQVRP
jgi:hypothetical protein